MADDKSRGNDDKSAAQGRRPFATLDLKATEIKVTPVASMATAATSMASKATTPRPIGPVPVPLPARAYWTSQMQAAGAAAQSGVSRPSGAPTAPGGGAGGTAGGNGGSGSGGSGGAERAIPAAAAPRRGGNFFTHLAAGVVGGLLALVAADQYMQRSGIGQNGDLSATAQRLRAIEKNLQDTGNAADLARRVDELERTAKVIPELKEAQTKFVADTKATLAASASDAGSPELITRLAGVEQQLQAMKDAGANDPNAGRLEQLAALTGKVADLETSLATQLNDLRKSVSADVDARVMSAATASEAAKSGTVRLDRDLATVKSDTARIEEQIGALQRQADKLSSAYKSFETRDEQLKEHIDDVGAKAAKMSDVTAAVEPIAGQLSTLKDNLAELQAAEAERKASAERVVTALELQNLKRTIDRGDNFDAELQSVRQAGGEKLDLSALEKQKAAGVATVQDLQKEFRAAANAIIDAEQEPADSGVVDKLLAGAKSIVRVRKINHAPDDVSVEAIVGRMQVAMDEGRLADVLEQAKSLSADAQAAARPFLDKVAARVSVDTAIAKLEDDLKSSITPSPAGGEPGAPAAGEGKSN